MSNFTILLAEDHPAWGELLRHSLNNIVNLEVQGPVRSNLEAVRAIEKHQPTLLVLDVMLSDGYSLPLCQYCQQLKRPVSTLILTAYDEDAYMAQALTSGAVGYLLKSETDLVEITEAIQRAAQGKQLWTSYQLLRIQHWQLVAGNQWRLLTDREKEVVAALTNFKSDAEIAEELQISLKTVGNHITHILEKLDMRNRREIARWAVRYKLVQSSK